MLIQMVTSCNRLGLSHLAVNNGVIVNREVSIGFTFHISKATVPLIDWHIRWVQLA